MLGLQNVPSKHMIMILQKKYQNQQNHPTSIFICISRLRSWTEVSHFNSMGHNYTVHYFHNNLYIIYTLQTCMYEFAFNYQFN